MKYPYDEDFEKNPSLKPKGKNRRVSNQHIRYVLRHNQGKTEDIDEFDLPLYYHEDHD